MPHPTKLQAAIFDWAGTIIDHGSRAPIEAFCEIFRREAVPITADEARGPMGMEKRDHIVALLAVPRIAAVWRDAKGREPTGEEVDRLYQNFLPVQLDLLAHHADVIPGVLDMLAACRQRGLRVGSSSGFARPLMDRLTELARASGLAVDAVVSASEVPAGRPAPWMIFQNMQTLGIYPPAAAVVVDDTIIGIEAARNAGAWAVGVTETGNMFGLSAEELAGLDPAQRQRQRQAAADSMLAAGAHFAIPSAADLLHVINAIDQRLARGERP